MAKKLLAITIALVLCVTAFAGCSSVTPQPVADSAAPAADAPASDAPAADAPASEAPASEAPAADGEGLEGTNIFMFKSTGNAFGDLMAEGFTKAVTDAGQKAAYKSPSETTVAAQVEMLDTLITQKVKSITISTNGDTGYDQVFKKAADAGIKIVSVDSKASPEYRLTHIDQTLPEAIGSSLVQAATLIALGIDYPEDGNMEAAVATALGSYSGPELKFGVLSAGIDTPVQNNWIAKMEDELAKDVYKGKVSATLDKKYGNDDPTESTTQANAFVSENAVNVIISPTTVGMASAGQVLKSSGSPIKLTGLGLPSEMQSFMPLKADDNAFDFVCPYMMLWDVIKLGEVAGAASLAAADGTYDGKVGSKFEYAGETFETVEDEDGGTRVIALDPYVFYKGNMSEWIDKL